MKWFISALAILPMLANVASAADKKALSDAQMDRLTAGVDCSLCTLASSSAFLLSPPTLTAQLGLPTFNPIPVGSTNLNLTSFSLVFSGLNLSLRQHGLLLGY